MNANTAESQCFVGIFIVVKNAQMRVKMAAPRQPKKLKPAREMFGTMVDSELLKRVRRYCGRQDITLTTFMNLAIKHYLTKGEEEENE